MSTFGTIFRVTTFGESHCKGVGAIIDGVPPRMCAPHALQPPAVVAAAHAAHTHTAPLPEHRSAAPHARTAPHGSGVRTRRLAAALKQRGVAFACRALTEQDIQPQLTRRRPGQSRLTTPRAEKDLVSILSGTEHGYTLGTPIGLMVPNEDQRPGDYKEMSNIPRYRP